MTAKATFRYRAYELVIELPFPCAGLVAAPADVAADVRVYEGAVPERLDEASAADRHWELAPGSFLFRGGRRAARFLVEGDASVRFERNAEAEDDVIAFFLLHVVMAAVMRRRGLLVLHANAAVAGDGAVVVVGDSGVGKSTTLAGLLARGCRLLSDDVAALRLSRSGVVEAVLGVPHFHLSQESAELAGEDVTGLDFRQWHRLKAAVPAGTRMADAPAPLRAVIALSTHGGDGVLVSRLEGMAKFAALVGATYGPEALEEAPSCVPVLTSLVTSVPVVRVERPRGRPSLDEVVDVVLGAGS